jgi:hypothetical protein
VVSIWVWPRTPPEWAVPTPEQEQKLTQWIQPWISPEEAIALIRTYLIRTYPTTTDVYAQKLLVDATRVDKAVQFKNADDHVTQDPRFDYLYHKDDLLGWLRLKFGEPQAKPADTPAEASTDTQQKPAEAPVLATADIVTACMNWLVVLRGKGPQGETTKKQYLSQARALFGDTLGPDQFETAWDAAARVVPRNDWGRPGRRRKPTS